MKEFAAHIAEMRLIDTHEHLHGEQEFVEDGPDLLQDLFDNDVTADLLVAGASEEAVRRRRAHRIYSARQGLVRLGRQRRPNCWGSIMETTV